MTLLVEDEVRIADHLDDARDRFTTVARHVLWFFGDRGEGQEPGGFVAGLLELFARADPENFAKLMGAFPLYGDVFNSAKNVAGGVDELRLIVQEMSR
jgi:hypothetical protein